MDKHDHARHIGEVCAECLAWRRLSDPNVREVMKVMAIRVYVALFRIRFQKRLAGYARA